MTVCCDSCKSPLSVLCGSPSSSNFCTVDTRQTVCKRFRSTKGASKARRDQINSEIRSMRALLPIPQDDQERLSYLHSMSIICTFIRKSILFQGLSAGPGSDSGPPYEAFLNALHGFILVLNAEGRLLYVSENVSEYLGHSMVDVLQGDSFYDMVERRDIDAVKTQLKMDRTSSPERSFVCQMHTSKAFRLQHGGCCSMLVQGRFQSAPQSSLPGSLDQRVFMALCTPTANRQRSCVVAGPINGFTSVHSPDMAFTRLSESVLFYLGYSVEEMIGRSWYSLLHPSDLTLSACLHKNLMEADDGSQVEMVLRFQHKDLTWTWVYIHATRDCGDRGVLCSNYIISETEATYLRRKIHSDVTKPQPCCPSPSAQLSHSQSVCLARCLKRQRDPSSQVEEPPAKTSLRSEPGVCYVTCASSDGDSPVTVRDSPALFSTPPYSPTSSHSPPQQEDNSSDFLLDVYSYTEQLMSSPESSPPYYQYPEAGHPSPFQMGSEQAYDLEAYTMTGAHSPESCPSPTYDYPVCPADARLVPDCLPVPDVCENTVDCTLHPEDLRLPVEPQGGSSPSHAHYAPQGLSPMQAVVPLTPSPSPTSTVGSFQYSEREQVEISILAQQISSLASSFDLYHTLSPVQTPSQPALETTCDWKNHATLSPASCHLKTELAVDEGVFDSILKDLDLVPGKEDTPLYFGHEQGLVSELDMSQQQPLEPNLVQQPLGLSLSSLVDSLPVDQFSSVSSTLETFPLQPACQDQHFELHQLNHYLHTSLQQDGLVEESMY